MSSLLFALVQFGRSCGSAATIRPLGIARMSPAIALVSFVSTRQIILGGARKRASRLLCDMRSFVTASSVAKAAPRFTFLGADSKFLDGPTYDRMARAQPLGLEYAAATGPAYKRLISVVPRLTALGEN